MNQTTNRRSWLITVCSGVGSLTSGLQAAQQSREPWSKSELLEPADLAKILNSSSKRPFIICVAFPVLYRQRHIIHAEFAGPTSKAEGIAALGELVANVPKHSEIVIYCGCCPMVNCPNIRPAYKALKELGLTDVRVLNLPESFHVDWVEKGFPTEAQLGMPAREPLREK